MVTFQRLVIFCAAVAIVIIQSSCNSKIDEAKEIIVVTNSQFESALYDLLGNRIKVIRLAEPGMCPGHFDIRPSQAILIQKSKILFRFDFQKSLDDKVTAHGTNKIKIVEIKATGGLCCPDTYYNICRQIADACVSSGLISAVEKDAPLKSIKTRLKSLENLCREKIVDAHLAGKPVLSSVHQQEFCRWLGLNVVGSFTAADVTGINEIEQAIDSGKIANVRLIIANKPEGSRLVDALAERLNAKVVMFGNFPEPENGKISFDRLVLNNIEALVKIADEIK